MDWTITFVESSLISDPRTARNRLLSLHPEEMDPPTPLRIFVLTDYNTSNSPESTTLVLAATSLVTLGLTNPGGTSANILRFTYLSLNLDNLSVVRHSGSSPGSALHYETPPSFRDALTLEHTDCSRDGGLCKGFLRSQGDYYSRNSF